MCGELIDASYEMSLSKGKPMQDFFGNPVAKGDNVIYGYGKKIVPCSVVTIDEEDPESPMLFLKPEQRGGGRKGARGYHTRTPDQVVSLGSEARQYDPQCKYVLYAKAGKIQKGVVELVTDNGTLYIEQNADTCVKRSYKDGEVIPISEDEYNHCVDDDTSVAVMPDDDEDGEQEMPF